MNFLDKKTEFDKKIAKTIDFSDPKKWKNLKKSLLNF